MYSGFQNRDLHGKFSASFPRVTAGNPAGEGTKLAGNTREGNTIRGNPAVAAIQIARLPRVVD
jgi:hypothetical protein